EEGLARRLLPGDERRPEALDARLHPLTELRRAAGIAERAQHPGHIAQRRMLLAALGQRPRRLALEIDDQEIVVRNEHLPEVIVAVVPRLERRAPGHWAGVDE